MVAKLKFKITHELLSFTNWPHEMGKLFYKITLKNTKKYKRGVMFRTWLLCKKIKYILKALFCCLLVVIGCADPPLPRGSWKKRVGDSLTVKCNLTDEEWTITCKGQKWSGVLGNCSKGRKLITNIFRERNILLV